MVFFGAANIRLAWLLSYDVITVFGLHMFGRESNYPLCLTYLLRYGARVSPHFCCRGNAEKSVFLAARQDFGMDLGFKDELS